jgi:hypothetical protein
LIAVEPTERMRHGVTPCRIPGRLFLLGAVAKLGTV